MTRLPHIRAILTGAAAAILCGLLLSLPVSAAVTLLPLNESLYQAAGPGLTALSFFTGGVVSGKAGHSRGALTGLGLGVVLLLLLLLFPGTPSLRLCLCALCAAVCGGIIGVA